MIAGTERYHNQEWRNQEVDADRGRANGQQDQNEILMKCSVFEDIQRNDTLALPLAIILPFVELLLALFEFPFNFARISLPC